MKIHNEKGVTLVELLATILISTIIIGVIYSVFIMTITKTKEDMNQKSFIKEQTAILQYMDRTMENVDDVEVVSDTDDSGRFTSFNAINIKTVEGADHSFTQQETSVPIAIANNNLEIDNTMINNDGISLDGTTFVIKNGTLQCNFVMKDTKNNLTKQFFASYKLRGEGD
ncbi:PilW family protein [Heyndrickxia ginsengihumi]|uniref:PilW family protein n=1 Tax=Heyndrickxia ginsengihumi TaxID=363870 RepID=UPI00203F7987|nr:prepilin-type N-terminal cleavage/methylation domain-containing protein [Heyndrickxia ginsengihumi]MCM3021900.1 prepilin-type N-terminal cleavage/methylation domain-containing protein [Heyndrickxia ginsengihumi]